MRFIFSLLMLLSVVAQSAELRLDFNNVPPGKTPPGFRSFVYGGGGPGDWQTVVDDVPPLLERLSEQAQPMVRRPVLAQLGTNSMDEHFPMLMLEGEPMGDFTLATRFKIVSGVAEQMAGIAFRIQNETNFYVIRASSLGRNIRFYRVMDGIRGDSIGNAVDIPKGVWQELKISCKASEIRCELNGREIIPTMHDSTFNGGRVAFWTKSDSVSYFTDTVINYKPKVPLAQTIVADMMQKYPRIMALKVYVPDGATNKTMILASKDAGDVGKAGGEYEAAVFAKGEIFFARAKDHVEIVMPLRDHNGEVIAAVRVHLTTFPGQTEQNALFRATPIVKEMQLRAQSAETLR